MQDETEAKSPLRTVARRHVSAWPGAYVIGAHTDQRIPANGWMFSCILGRGKSPRRSFGSLLRSTSRQIGTRLIFCVVIISESSFGNRRLSRAPPHQLHLAGLITYAETLGLCKLGFNSWREPGKHMSRAYKTGSGFADCSSRCGIEREEERPPMMRKRSAGK